MPEVPDAGATGAEEAFGHVVEGLRLRLEQIRRAEDQLSAFAWKEGSAVPDGPGTAGDWTPLFRRVLHVATEGDAFRVLKRLVTDGDTTVAGLTATLETDRMATVDRVSALTQAGLVGRDLETDRVGATRLGRGVVELIVEMSRAAAGAEEEA